MPIKQNLTIQYAMMMIVATKVIGILVIKN